MIVSTTFVIALIIGEFIGGLLAIVVSLICIGFKSKWVRVLFVAAVTTYILCSVGIWGLKATSPSEGEVVEVQDDCIVLKVESFRILVEDGGLEGVHEGDTVSFELDREEGTCVATNLSRPASTIETDTVK